ncbi:MAG: glycoside hydrolase family 88 protein [Clostridia bacterium]|nr:glycoside hydrolase family 88 protein [Clostridia bacterium]
MRPVQYAVQAVETMMRKFDSPSLPPKGRFHYHQGVFLSGVYQTYLLTGKEAYYEYVKRWVDSIVDENGVVTNFDKGQLDDIQPGILLFRLYEKTGDERYKKALDTLCPIIYNFPRNAEGGFWHKERYPEQMWLDGLYMGGPIIAEYAKAFNHPEYFDLVCQQALLMQEKTRDEKTGLLYHAWDAVIEREWADPVTGRSPEFWGRSIGWAAVGVLDDLEFLPGDHPMRRDMEKLVRDLLTALISFQSEEGRWYQVVDKVHEEGNWPENSCSCLFTAAICRAVRRNIVSEDMLEYAKKGFKGVIDSLTWIGDDIQIGNVCIGTGVGDYTHYINRPTSVNDLHGVGAFLLMCAEAEKAGLE